MKNLFMLLTLAVIIACSLDTFKSDNIASWSINLDVPLYKTAYTYGDLLKDYDELGVEQYGNTNDSIYVFNASTPHIIEVQDYAITKDGDDILPEVVTIEQYELEIPTLPKELAGINFVDIDLTLEVDLTQFKVFLADSVIVDNITITGTNDDGEEEIATMSNQDVLINGTLVIEDPEDLINIRPTRVVISGQITIYPSDQPGTEVSNQIIVLTSVLHAPLILEINETSTFTTSPQKVIGDISDQVSYTMTLFTKMDNQMELGLQLNFLISPDTMNFEPNSLIIPDTLISIHLVPDQEQQLETIELGQDKYELLADSTYMKVFINLIGNKDNQGNTTPTRFFTNDSLKVLLYSSTELLIDPQDRGRGE